MVEFMRGKMRKSDIKVKVARVWSRRSKGSEMGANSMPKTLKGFPENTQEYTFFAVSAMSSMQELDGKMSNIRVNGNMIARDGVVKEAIILRHLR